MNMQRTGVIDKVRLNAGRTDHTFAVSRLLCLLVPKQQQVAPGLGKVGLGSTRETMDWQSRRRDARWQSQCTACVATTLSAMPVLLTSHSWPDPPNHRYQNTSRRINAAPHQSASSDTDEWDSDNADRMPRTPPVSLPRTSGPRQIKDRHS